eukprot:4923762-Pleurochrysis_carterae.AAC.3
MPAFSDLKQAVQARKCQKKPHLPIYGFSLNILTISLKNVYARSQHVRVFMDARRMQKRSPAGLSHIAVNLQNMYMTDECNQRQSEGRETGLDKRVESEL